MVSRSYLQRNEWPAGFCGFPYGMGTVLGFSLNRVGSPVVECVMLLQNSKLQEAGCICLILHCVSVARMVPGIYVCLYRDSTRVYVLIKEAVLGGGNRLTDEDLITQSSPVSTLLWLLWFLSPG